MVYIIGAVIAVIAMRTLSKPIDDFYDKLTCRYQISAGGNCITQEEYFKIIAYNQAQEALADLELFCTPVSNHMSPRCSFFFEHY